MTIFITAHIPILILIILGYALKRSKFLSDEAWSGMEKLTYFVLFPALLIRTLGEQSLTGTPWPSMLMVVVGTVMTTVILLITFRKSLSKNDATFTSIFQGGVRFNTYIAFAIAQSLYGASGLAMSSVVAGFMIVLINVWCVLVFVVWGKAKFQGVLAFVKEIVGNPLIIACAIGWFLSLSGIGLPLVASSLIFFTGLSGIASAVLIIAFMTPTAPSAYVLARQLGGDTDTMASIITVQTLLAFLLMPLLGALLL